MTAWRAPAASSASVVTGLMVPAKSHPQPGRVVDRRNHRYRHTVTDVRVAGKLPFKASFSLLGSGSFGGTNFFVCQHRGGRAHGSRRVGTLGSWGDPGSTLMGARVGSATSGGPDHVDFGCLSLMDAI